MSTSNPKNLAGKVALITGGSRSIGAAIAKRLAAAGATVAFTYAASPDKADEVVKAIAGAGGRALAIKADAADPAAVRQAVTETVKSFGGIDILVNNAGALAVAPIEKFTLEDFDRMIAVNVRGPEPGGGNFFALNTASVTELGHENTFTQWVIRLWHDTRHLSNKPKQS